MFRCDAIVVILGCYYYDLVSRSVRISPELTAKIMNSDEKTNRETSFFTSFCCFLAISGIFSENNRNFAPEFRQYVLMLIAIS